MKKLVYLLMLLVMFSACKKKASETETLKIDEQMITQTIDSLVALYGENNKVRIEKGVNQVAALWQAKDGTAEDFHAFCKSSFIGNEEALKQFYLKFQQGLEVLYGNFNKISVDLKLPLHLDLGPVEEIDMLFGSYEPSAHLMEDLFSNKLAFKVALNFPFYSLQEKESLGKDWDRLQWAYVRMGDLFTSRVPAELFQKVSEVMTNADTYISDYNIFMGNLVDDKGNILFPPDLKLISHWGLRDELKANYKEESGFAKQMMIYEVMKHIIHQSIPADVINSSAYLWNPYKNTLTKDGKKVEFKSEDNVRYQHLLNNYMAMKDIDAYSPHYPTYIKRKFEAEMELTQEDVEKLFTDLCSSGQVKEVAELIKKRLGRDLQPFDIWYDGFKSRNSIPQAELDKAVRTKYPSKEAFEKDLPNILIKLDFKPDMAAFISSKIAVDASRGAGHAWGALMKSDKARLRTRIEADGMNYKGYNIAIHEFGHNVEQTITLHKVDHYLLNGVPNTAFTEALAFIFQKRDLQLLGMKDNNPDKAYLETLDAFWSAFEIMGVSLVDMNVWKWLYDHPDATAAELKKAVTDISVDVWNKYFAEAFGIKDQPILAIYSHMIDYPLYLSAYPIGQLIEFQVEKQIAGKNFADEVYRMYTEGRIIPQLWMKNAVGKEISTKPMLEEVEKAIDHFKQ